MPDREVQTIRDLIYYQYAKIIAKSAFSAENGKFAKTSITALLKRLSESLNLGKNPGQIFFGKISNL